MQSVSEDFKNLGNLDELTIYLEICKHENILANLKENFSAGINNLFQFQKDITHQKQIIASYMNLLSAFGIDITNPDYIEEWKCACANFLSQLTPDDYYYFVQLRTTCQSLGFLYPHVEGESSFYVQPTTEKQKQIS